MLAAHFGVEIVVCSCESLSFLRYDPGSGNGRRAHLLYTGQHYDPLLSADGALTVAADADAASLEAAALAIAREHNAAAARRAAEKRVNRLKCAGCGAILADAAAFQELLDQIDIDADGDLDLITPGKSGLHLLKRN